MESKTGKHQHHILSTRLALAVGGTLLVLTWFTVWIAGVDLGPLNFPIAMLVATVKALLVTLIFMNLLYDRVENGVIFGTSFLFLLIFVVLTVTDLFFRGDVYVKGPLLAPVAQTKAKFSKPWVRTPELVAHGKELFATQCVSCHGAEGKGNGPAAAALVPPPRNFTVAEGWKNGRKPSHVFKTLKEGVPGSSMASYGTLPSDDLWGLVHYVISIGPTVPVDSREDLVKVGIDPDKEGGGAGANESPTIPIEFAIQRMVEE